MKRVASNKYAAWAMWPVMTAVAFFVGAYLIARLHALLASMGILPGSSTLVIIALGAVGLVLALVLVGLFARFVSKDRLTPKFFGLKRELQWRDIGLGLAGLVLYMLLSGSALWLVSRLVPGFDMSEEQDIGFSMLLGVDQRIAGALLLIVVAPVVEETIFRGVLYGKLRSLRMPVWLSVVAVSVSFAVLHGQWNVAIDVFVLSVVACLLREATGTIWPGVIIHMVKNSIAFYVLFVLGQ